VGTLRVAHPTKLWDLAMTTNLTAP
jgi:hypothetical protein